MTTNKRRGAATVELAVSMPLLIVIALGTIETCTAIFTMQALQSTAHECARTAADSGATNAAVIDVMNQFVEQRSLANPVLTLDPPDCSAVEAGELITVTVTAEPGGAGFINHSIFGDTVEASCTYMKSY